MPFWRRRRHWSTKTNRVAFYIPEEMGGLDGMAIDSEDMLWVAPV
jgi:sugar lactone lactonase YvrE